MSYSFLGEKPKAPLLVSLSRIDGAIDSPFIREILPDVDALRSEDRILDPDAIAQAYVMLHRQPRSAWTQELDLRPWAESW